jgi:hypothetical protein
MGVQNNFPMHARVDDSLRQVSVTFTNLEACASAESATARIGGGRILAVHLDPFGVHG